MMKNETVASVLSATNPGPRPGDFALGSAQSRAELPGVCCRSAWKGASDDR